jgi:MoxR-like ATPase
MALVQMLEQLVCAHSCVLLVGPASCGKTALWHLLQSALQKVFVENNTSVSLMPQDVLRAYHVRCSRLCVWR